MLEFDLVMRAAREGRVVWRLHVLRRMMGYGVRHPRYALEMSAPRRGARTRVGGGGRGAHFRRACSSHDNREIAGPVGFAREGQSLRGRWRTPLAAGGIGSL